MTNTTAQETKEAIATEILDYLMSVQVSEQIQEFNGVPTVDMMDDGPEAQQYWSGITKIYEEILVLAQSKLTKKN